MAIAQNAHLDTKAMRGRLPTLYLIRHGESEDNVARRISGQSDSPLTAQGREQAIKNGRLLRELVGDIGGLDVVSSSLGRAATTLALVLEAAGASAQTRADPRLMESHFGEWTKKPIADAFAFREADLKRHAGEEIDWRWPGGESQGDVLARVEAFLGELTRDTVIVGHAGSITAARGLALGIPRAQIWPHGFGNVGIIRIQDQTEARFKD